ncbi:MAG: CocE/NonD family hydrolase [Pseudomonadota bacterium]
MKNATKSKSLLASVAQWLVYGLCLVIFSAVALVSVAQIVPTSDEKKTPSGLTRYSGQYVTMPDGIDIAVDRWLPENYQQGDRLPTIMRMTRYTCHTELGWLGRVISLVKGEMPNMPWGYPYEWNRQGYASVCINARGTASSFGKRYTLYSPEEIADYKKISEWITRQSWSDGKIGTTGASYSGNTSIAAQTTGAEGIKVGIVDVFDAIIPFALGRPGGALNKIFMDPWTNAVRKIDSGKPQHSFNMEGSTNFDRWLASAVVSGLKRVDNDRDGKILKQLLRERTEFIDPSTLLRENMFIDNVIPLSQEISGRALYAYDMSPCCGSNKEKLEQSKSALLIRTGWFDAATTDFALSMFNSFEKPMIMVIGAHAHFFLANPMPLGGQYNKSVPQYWKASRGYKDDWRTYPDLSGVSDPFTNEIINDRGLEGIELSILEQILKQNAKGPLSKTLFYYTINQGWNTASSWPPKDMPNERLYLAAEHKLSSDTPASTNESDPYKVDFDAVSAEFPRWDQLSYVDYRHDRAELEGSFISYTAPPLKADTEITGHPVVDLRIATSATDGLFIAYLEAVAPTGQVIYLTEGVLRGLHRKTTDEPQPFNVFPPFRTFLREDAEEMQPGKVETLSFRLNPLSIVLPKGFRLRLSLAGADNVAFDRVPTSGDVNWRVHRSQLHPSSITIPMETAESIISRTITW